MEDNIKVTKKALQGFIKYKISTNKTWALRALVVIYNDQDEDEKRFNIARKRNNVGFSKVDASEMCILAQKVRRKLTITSDNMNIIHRKMPKYWRQILDKCDRPKLDSLYRKYIIDVERTIESH